MIRFVRRLKFLVNFKKSLPFLRDFFLSKEVKVKTKIFSLLLMVGYILFPFDIIPDFLIVFGVIDDVAVAGLILQQMVKMAPESLKVKHGLAKT
ncbi:YkvA family protein [Sediminibacillus albus]|uniref:DUF1232 domain-containing protein n=1 Tax=Sediminibacillus albus TaxID=407036 RepID=A0A1G9AT13_9BACI|nr:DUF1232 domain-containing protein [Sediminibacillus albus]SDK30401.1 Protein of unknown function [Sediminibacillus albus]